MDNEACDILKDIFLKKKIPYQLLVGRISDKNNIAWKSTYAETVANYVTPRVAPQIDIDTHV